MADRTFPAMPVCWIVQRRTEVFVVVDIALSVRLH